MKEEKRWNGASKREKTSDERLQTTVATRLYSTREQTALKLGGAETGLDRVCGCGGGAVLHR